jgi:hypothetical protein
MTDLPPVDYAADISDIAAEFPQYDIKRTFGPRGWEAHRQLTATCSQTVAATSAAGLLDGLRKVRDREAGA